MKKFLSLIASFGLVAPLVANVISCDSVSTIESILLETNIENFGFLFSKGNDFKMIESDYLKFINNQWTHLGFEKIISQYKITAGNIPVTKENKNVLESISKTSGIQISDNKIDLTGVGFDVENIFINSVKDEEGVLKVSATLALTVKVGWVVTGKILFNTSNATSYLNCNQQSVSLFNSVVVGELGSIVGGTVKETSPGNFDIKAEEVNNITTLFDNVNKKIMHSIQDMNEKQLEILISEDKKSITVNFFGNKIKYNLI